MKNFYQKTPLNFETSFDSVILVADEIKNLSNRLFVSSNESGNRGFLITNEKNQIHTMFTLPCTKENKVPSLFKEMLLIAPFNISEEIVFLNRKGYNSNMIKFFIGSSKHAGIENIKIIES